MDAPRHAICLNCEREFTYYPGDPAMCSFCGANYGVLEKIMSEFCPKCNDPLDITPEPDRLCEKCGWFGDKSETLAEPTITGDAEANVRKALALYKDQCRNEMILEQCLEQGKITLHDMMEGRAAVKRSVNSLMSIFQALLPKPESDE